MVARTTPAKFPVVVGLLAACAAPATPANAPSCQPAADLSGVKSYLLTRRGAAPAHPICKQPAPATTTWPQTTGFDYATLAVDPVQAAQRCPTPRQPAGWLPARSTNRDGGHRGWCSPLERFRPS